MHDVVFVSATVVDGSGRPPYRASVAADGNRITKIAATGTLQGPTMVDASKLVLAPGFIDFHSHAEWNLPLDEQEELLLPFLRQGVTTFAGGNCGFSPYPVDEDSKKLVYGNSQFLTHDSFRFNWLTQNDFVQMVERKGTLLNVGLLTGHGSLRALIKGNDPSPLTPPEQVRMGELIHEAKMQGSFGISLGLSYIPSMFANRDELRSVFVAAAKDKLLVTVHGHTYSWTSPFFDSDDPTPHNVRDIQLLTTLAKESGASLHLSHVLLKGRKTWETLPAVLGTIEAAVREGCDVTFGVIPYHWGNTLIKTLLPNWFLEHFDRNIEDAGIVARLGRELEDMEASIGRTNDDLILLWGGESALLRPYEGKTFRQIAIEKELSGIQTILWIIRESEGKARILTASYSGQEGIFSEPLQKLLEHERSIVEIDAIVTDTAGPQTPAASEAFPRLLGTYCRRDHLFTLAQAVRKITGKPADRLGLSDRGYIREGAIADLVLFDAETVGEGCKVARSGAGPTGIRQVWMNGEKVLEDGLRVLKKRNGTVILQDT